MSYWPGSVPPDGGRLTRAVVGETARRVARSARRLISWWPGIGLVVVAYVAVTLALLAHSYPNLWGALAAVVVGAVWYATPLRHLESRRRNRLRLKAAETVEVSPTSEPTGPDA
jgi:hypothetical protein